jgi:urease accessory protein
MPVSNGLPLETIAFSGCNAESALRFDLEAGAEMIGWDVLALGLPASDQSVRAGPLPAVDRAARTTGSSAARSTRPIAACSTRRSASRAGARWACCVSPPAARSPTVGAEALLESARGLAAAHPLARTAGITAVQPDVVVLRVPRAAVEPAIGLMTTVWQAWRREAWTMSGTVPRVWRT